MISQDTLKQTLSYDPLTGKFTWLAPKPRSGKKPGDRAGSYDGRGYIQITIGAKTYKAHRLAWLYMNGDPIPEVIDHIDRKRDNNIFSNLRAGDYTLNSQNRTPMKHSSKYIGVGWLKARKRWRAKITVGGDTILLGYFKDEYEAHLAYEDAKKKYHPGAR
jgi:hypothetical protein